MKMMKRSRSARYLMSMEYLEKRKSDLDSRVGKVCMYVTEYGTCTEHDEAKVLII